MIPIKNKIPIRNNDLEKRDLYRFQLKNGFRVQKYNISPPGQRVSLPLNFGIQVAIILKLIGACSLLFRPKDNTQLASGLKCKSLEI
jgi:hypothetical protein